jgi:hypothetical protein
MANHKFTQGISGRVTTEHYVDEINIINELRQIVEDLATIVGQVKLGDGQYPADESIGIQASNVVKNNFWAEESPTVNDDITQGYAKGSLWMDWEDVYICFGADEGEAIWRRLLTEEILS